MGRVLTASRSGRHGWCVHRSPEDTKLGTEIKDAMRVRDVYLLVDGWYQILNQYYQDTPGLINNCLAVIGLYVSWIDVSLVVNERFIPLLFGYLEVTELRCVERRRAFLVNPLELSATFQCCRACA